MICHKKPTYSCAKGIGLRQKIFVRALRLCPEAWNAQWTLESLQTDDSQGGGKEDSACAYALSTSQWIRGFAQGHGLGASGKTQLVSAGSWLIAGERRSLHCGELARTSYSRPATAQRDARVPHGLNVGFPPRRITSSQLRRRSGVRPLRRRGLSRFTPQERPLKHCARLSHRFGRTAHPMTVPLASDMAPRLRLRASAE